MKNHQLAYFYLWTLATTAPVVVIAAILLAMINVS